MFKVVLSQLISRNALSNDEIGWFIGAVNRDELSAAQIAGFLVALTMKGATVEEITSIVLAMRKNCLPLKPRVQPDLMDTCGTGGGRGTFNISTATAVVAAAGGIPIAKHGSRSISSLSGSADVLEALGVEINLGPQAVEKMIEEIGIAFIYAPLFHPVMGKVLPPEKALGIKTIFYSIIGPLVNPACPHRHLLGVYKPQLLDILSQVAPKVGYTHAMFVHGLDGLDEISLLGKTRIYELKGGGIEVYEVAPEDFGLPRCTLGEIKDQEPQKSADIIAGIFARRITNAARRAIILNAGAALKIGGKAATLADGITLAGELIDSGAAERKLNQLREMSHSFGNQDNGRT